MFPSWDAVAFELFSARERRCRAHAEVHSHSRLAIADANPTLVIFVIFAFYSPAVKTGKPSEPSQGHAGCAETLGRRRLLVEREP